MQNENEHVLITDSLAGDQRAYEQLVDRYKNALYCHCYALVRDEDAAEDIAQQTFITVYYKLALYKTEYRFSTWLFKVATNKALTYLKQRGREVAADDSLIATVAATSPGPHVNAEYAELRAAVDKLKPKYRAAISLYYWQGLSYQEIADVMGWPLGSVKVWMLRAKTQLRKELS